MLLLCVALLAAPLDVQTRTLSRGGKHDALKLPFVAGSGAVAERINTVVYITLISAAPPSAEGAIAESEDSKWFASLEFTTPRNDDRLIELAFTGETCGAYCEPFSLSLTFDAHTGRSIALFDVVNARGMALIAQRVKAERVRRYSEQVRRLSRISYPDKDTGDRLTVNRECLDHESRHATLIDPMAASFTAKGITVRSERCSNHAMRAFDDVGEVSIVVAYKDLATTMTPYGKALLTGGGDVAAPDDPFGQALRGTIGSVAVTVVLERPGEDGSFNGHYFYDKQRKLIALRGRRNADGTIEITEAAEMHFLLKQTGPGLLGKWSDRSRTLDVHLSESPLLGAPPLSR